MVGAVIYVRVSTEEQTENLSLPTQLRAGMRAALELGRWTFPAPIGYLNAAVVGMATPGGQLRRLFCVLCRH